MRTQYFWTPEVDEKLRQLIAQKLTSAECARQLKKSKLAVDARRLKLGLQRRAIRFTADDDAKITSLYLSNIPVNEIADALKRTYASIRMRVNTLGLVRDSRRTKLGIRYGVESISNGKDTALIIAEIREATEKQKEAERAAKESKIDALLDEMERGLNAGCDRSFMFTAALVGGATLQAISDRVGLTRERVRQVIEMRAQALEVAENQP